MLLRVAVVAALLGCLLSAPALAAPTVTIDSGPDGPTNESSPTFGFTVQNATAVECSVDQGTQDFGPCTTASSHTDGSLADGDWTFRVRATDDVPETTTETRDFTIDTEAPTVSLAGGRPNRPDQRPPAQLHLDGGRGRPEPARVLARLGHALVRGLHEPHAIRPGHPARGGQLHLPDPGRGPSRQHRDRHPHVQRRPHPAYGHPHGPRPHGAHERSAPKLRLDHRGRECPPLLARPGHDQLRPVHVPKPA